MRLLPTHDNLFCAFTFSSRSRECAKSLKLKPWLYAYVPEPTFRCVFICLFSDADDVSSAEELEFVVDPIVTSGIEKGREIAKKFANDLKVVNVFFDKFGKVDLKKRRVITWPLKFTFFGQMLSRVWNNHYLSLRLKSRVNKCCVLIFLLFYART